MNTEKQTDAPAVSLTHVDVAFETRGSRNVHLALDDVSLEACRGELLVVVGRSGCGKTTVLNVVAGLAAVTKGEVCVLGMTPKAARPHMSYMFARDALLPWRTATRNIEFALELRCPELGRHERRERAGALLEELGVRGDAQNRYPWQLSQGMRQRVALARTWTINPDVLLMDEPFAALDAQTREDAQALFLQTWSRSRKTVIFVTHDLSEAILLGERVIVMDRGRIVDEVRIEIPQPRDPSAIVEDPIFRDIHHRLSAALRGTSHNLARRSTSEPGGGTRVESFDDGERDP